MSEIIVDVGPRRKRRNDDWAKRNRERHRENVRRWRAEHPEKAAELARISREKVKAYHIKLRYETFEHYGGAKCACCGETTYEFLCIDHINGGGNAHRRTIVTAGKNIYLYLKRNNYPPGYQVLCYNCNNAKGFYGKCPHQGEREQNGSGSL
jgi:hypothetical protein